MPGSCDYQSNMSPYKKSSKKKYNAGFQWTSPGVISLNQKLPLKPPLFIGSIVGILFSLIIIFLPNLGFPAQGSNTQPVSPTSTPVVQTGPGLPVRLKIPKLKVNAAIEYVGINSKGEMGAPKIPRNAAWFSLGARPGEMGSAVIAGHVNWYNGATAVFANLSKLKPGNKIIIQDDKGNIISFVVRKVHAYGVKEDASEVFDAADDLAHLNLITCVGVWDKKAKQYSKRLVVFADRE